MTGAGGRTRAPSGRNRRLLRVLVLNTALLFGSIACESEQSSVGTNTNWMRLCDEDSQCDEDDACLCQRCTRACEADDDCPNGSSCTLGSATRLQCGVDGSRTCQPLCHTDADCDAARVCHQGSCVDAEVAFECPTAALVCEDFEENLGEHSTIATPGNSVARVERSTPSGDFSLEATATEAPSVAYLRADVSPLSSGELFLSGWVHVPEDETHDVAPLGFWSATDEDWALRMVIRNGQLELWTHTTAHDGPFELASAGWHCLEMHVVIGEAAGTPSGSVTVSVDEEPALFATDIDTLPTAGIESLAMGTLWAGLPATVWVDRVVLSTERTSCYGD